MKITYILNILVLVTCLLSNSVALANAPTPNKHIMLCYLVDDSILACQNDDEDMVRGQIEFEKELMRHYSNRFHVDVIEKITPADLVNELSDYVAKKTPKQHVLLLIIRLAGQGERIDEYQNAFGAKKYGKSPTTKLAMAESIFVEPDKVFYNMNYGLLEYGAGTVAVGKDVYVLQKNARKNTKNAVRGAFRDACKFDTSINKYASPKLYKKEVARFLGDFKEYHQDTLANNERYNKFIAWCQMSPERQGYLNLFNSTNDHNIKIQIIESVKKYAGYIEL